MIRLLWKRIALATGKPDRVPVLPAELAIPRGLAAGTPAHLRWVDG